MTPRLPKSLAREPLVDAVFEVRLRIDTSLADVLPGFLFHILEPKPIMVRLPAAEIPMPMRSVDQALQFAPILRLEWTDFYVSVGDRNVVISCKLPYPKWPKFKVAILDVMNQISRINIEGYVERYSIKYANIIPEISVVEQIKKIKMSLRLGTDEISSDKFSIQVHRNEEDTVHVISVLIGAEAKFPDGNIIQGALVDIDSINVIQSLKLSEFVNNLDHKIEKLRQSNKAKFFGCLTEAAIEEMGPSYE